MIAWLRAWYRRWWVQRLQRFDLEIVWPAIKKQAPSLEDARDVFQMHMTMDSIYDEMTVEELEAFVEEKLV